MKGERIMSQGVSQIIEFQGTNVWMRVMGAMFMFVPIGFGTMYFTSDSFRTDNVVGLWLFLFVFGVVGLGLFGGFRRVVVDGQARTALKQWGVFRPFSTRHYALSETRTVSIHQEVRTSGSGHRSTNSGSRRRKYTVYPVRLVGVKREGPISDRDKKKLLAAAALGKNVEGEFAQQLLKGLQTQAKDDIENLVISDLRDPVRARRDAERIAKLLGLAIEDRVGETTSRREYNELDQSLIERLRENNTELTDPATLSRSNKIQVVDQGAGNEYRIPVANRWVRLAMIVAGASFFVFRVYKFGGLGDHAQEFLVAMIAVVVSVLVFLRYGKHVITVDLHRIAVDTRLMGIKIYPGRGLLASDLEEIIRDKKSISLVSDTQRIRINTASLNSDDERFLHDSIIFTISR